MEHIVIPMVLLAILAVSLLIPMMRGLFSAWDAVLKGKRDGKRHAKILQAETRPVAAADGVVTPLNLIYFEQLKHDANSKIRAIAERCQKKILSLETSVQKLSVLRDALKIQLKYMISSIAEKRIEYESKYNQPAPTIPPSRTGYHLLLVLLAILEVPLNYFSMQLFGESEVITFLLTLAAGSVLIASAHFLGQTLLVNPKRMVDISITALLAGIPVPLIAGITLLRVSYINNISQASDLFGRISISPWAVGLISLALTTLVYVVATIASYRHVEDPLIGELRRLLAKQARIHGRYLKVMVRLRGAVTKVNSRKQSAKKHAERVRSVAYKLMSIYQDSYQARFLEKIDWPPLPAIDLPGFFDELMELPKGDDYEIQSGESMEEKSKNFHDVDRYVNLRSVTGLRQ